MKLEKSVDLHYEKLIQSNYALYTDEFIRIER